MYTRMYAWPQCPYVSFAIVDLLEELMPDLKVTTVAANRKKPLMLLTSLKIKQLDSTSLK